MKLIQNNIIKINKKITVIKKNSKKVFFFTKCYTPTVFNT